MAFKCEICDLVFKKDSLLTSHIGIHIGRKCRDCKSKWDVHQSPDSLKSDTKCIGAHRWLLTQSPKFPKSAGPVSKPRIIPPYDKSTVTAQNMTKENEWQCQFCEYKTVSRHRLTKHMRTHTNERPYKCDQCGMWFISNSHGILP